MCSCSRDRFAVRLFYRAFAGEPNVGYRELMTLGELVERIEGAGPIQTLRPRSAKASAGTAARASAIRADASGSGSGPDDAQPERKSAAASASGRLRARRSIG